MKCSLSESFLVLLLAMFVNYISVSLAFTFSGNRLRDLESFEETEFAEEASYWSASSLVSNSAKYSFCYNMYLLGGYNILSSGSDDFTRIYSGLPVHNMIFFSFLFQPVDSWDGTADHDYVEIIFDSTTFKTWEIQHPLSSFPNLCGKPTEREFPTIIIIIQVLHSSTTLTFQVKGHLSEPSNNEAFGFRDIDMTFFNSSNPQSSFCGKTSVSLSSDWCECPSPNHYQNPVKSGICYPCHSSCASCSGSSSSQCLSCNAGYYLSSGQCSPCDTKCATCDGGTSNDCLTCSSGEFLVLNKTCAAGCPYPLIQTSNGTINFCSSPCPSTLDYIWWDRTCSSSSTSCYSPLQQSTWTSNFRLCTYPCKVYEYLYWNGTCASTCEFPLSTTVVKSRNLCQYPCSAGDYLYWDGTCKTSCSSPLLPRIQAGDKYCDPPCPISNYHYWNGSCLSSCDPPLQASTVAGTLACSFPCSSTQVAYWDGSCSSTCTFPLILKSEGTLVRNFCIFPCLTGEFLYWNRTCSPACIPPLTNYYQYGQPFCSYPCLAAQFLHWDGSCKSTCDTPLSSRVEAGKKYCDFPCSSSEYLFWNKSCLGSCLFPLQTKIQGPYMFCNFPCSSTDFLYSNGSCLSQCLVPQVQKIEGNPARQFCNNKCPSDEYYYSRDNTCKSNCNSPLVMRFDTGIKYCDYPCPSSQYLYWNRSCLATCDFPLQARIENGIQYCDFPCVLSTSFLYWNSSCLPDCKSPFVASYEGSGSHLRKFCKFGCQSNEYLYWNDSCQKNCSLPLRIRVERGFQYCSLPCDNPYEYFYEDTKTCLAECKPPFSVNPEVSFLKCQSPPEEDGWIVENILTASIGRGPALITLIKMMEYLRYLDIRMPPRLERLILSKGRNIMLFKLGYFVSEEDQRNFATSILPTPFQKHNLHSNFIVNFWQDLTSFGIIMLLAIMFILLENISKLCSWRPWNLIFERLRRITKWNLLLIVVANNIDYIILYSSLQYRGLAGSGNSTLTIIGFFAGLAMNILSICLLVFTFKLTQEAQSVTNNTSKESESHNFITRWQDYQVLFFGMKDKPSLKQMFYLIYTVRVGLPMVIASYLFAWPIVQMVLQVIISLLITAYIIFMRPIKKQINNIQLIIFEVSILIMNCCVLILSILSKSGSNQLSLQVFLGDITIFGNFALNVILILFLIIKVGIEIKKFYRGLKYSSKKDRTVWLQILMVPIQQAGMGFEEVCDKVDQDYPQITDSKTYFQELKLKSKQASESLENSDKRIKNKDIQEIRNKRQFNNEDIEKRLNSNMNNDFIQDSTVNMVNDNTSSSILKYDLDTLGNNSLASKRRRNNQSKEDEDNLESKYVDEVSNKDKKEIKDRALWNMAIRSMKNPSKKRVIESQKPIDIIPEQFVASK